jgi:hypothetical protein
MMERGKKDTRKGGLRPAVYRLQLGEESLNHKTAHSVEVPAKERNRWNIQGQISHCQNTPFPRVVTYKNHTTHEMYITLEEVQ